MEAAVGPITRLLALATSSSRVLDTSKEAVHFLSSPRRAVHGNIVPWRVATQAVGDFGSSAFVDRIPHRGSEAILVNSARIRYAAGTIAFQPWDPDRAEILEVSFARAHPTSPEGLQA